MINGCDSQVCKTIGRIIHFAILAINIERRRQNEGYRGTASSINTVGTNIAWSEWDQKLALPLIGSVLPLIIFNQAPVTVYAQQRIKVLFLASAISVIYAVGCPKISFIAEI